MPHPEPVDEWPAPRTVPPSAASRKPLVAEQRRADALSSQDDVAIPPSQRPERLPQAGSPRDPGVDPWAEPRPRSTQRAAVDAEPIDVEPEALNDPW
jgi:hypothetical protein